ncbi:baseplate J/gp47 family protein [Novosphingobium sp. PP1Y]|uniref:baseplate assembly protein n=1 Tax=Novosphingobium sp. PP1Y TaxID=702113 RepID=UPI00020EE7D3|nr:baseplate J/gp47 family protein [Novosphingobium sp. PP1Y]CCA91317.1 putative phage baseplate assembly protein [Novosphingobium sp. PP1Y]
MADATFTAVDLSRLPAPDIVEELDFETILADAVARMQAQMPEFITRDSDPATKLLQVFAYFAQLLRQRVNDAVRAVMPAYAVGADLDNIAALFGITRFTLASADEALGIPAVMESDADFRRRMVLAPEGYSVAGPEGAYIFHALSADADVLDASATSPAAGEVLVSVLSRTGSGAASAALVSKVAAYVSDETRRPLTDFVTVQSAEIVTYAVEATLTTFSGPDGGVVLAAAHANLDAYIASSHRLGRDITRSAIFAALHVEGVQNVELSAPAADIIVSRTQAPHCTGTTINYAGTGE